MEDILTSLETWGYLALAFFSFGGSLLVVVGAGLLSYMGYMNPYYSIIIAMLFNYIGDMFLFYLGKYHKRDIHQYFKRHKRKIALSTLIMRKYGVWAIFIQKFLYGIKTLVPISMGLSKYDFKKFGFYNIFASALFVIVIFFASYFAGETIKSFFEAFRSYPYIPILFLVAVVALIWYLMGNLTKK